MRRLSALFLLAASLGFASAGCGTSSGPGGGNGAGGHGTEGQDTNQQPSAGGLRTPAYTAAHNSCSLFPLAELARQNGTKATPQAVAKVVAAGETTPAARKEAYQGCLDGIAAK
jgi:hypothetical protein